MTYTKAWKGMRYRRLKMTAITKSLSFKGTDYKIILEIDYRYFCIDINCETDNSCLYAEDKVTCSRTQHSDSAGGGARTSSPSNQSPTLFQLEPLHSAEAHYIRTIFEWYSNLKRV